MSFESAFNFLKEKGFSDRVSVFSSSSATVALASERLGVPGAMIAKTMCFKGKDRDLVVVSAGDTKVVGGAFKRTFGFKPSLATPDETFNATGHHVGGVCPFALQTDIPVYLDESLKRFEYVYPAVGDDRSAVKLTPDELFSLSGAKGYVGVFKVVESDE